MGLVGANGCLYDERSPTFQGKLVSLVWQIWSSDSSSALAPGLPGNPSNKLKKSPTNIGHSGPFLVGEGDHRAPGTPSTKRPKMIKNGQ